MTASAQAVAAERRAEAEEEQETGGPQPMGEAGAHDAGHQKTGAGQQGEVGRQPDGHASC